MSRKVRLQKALAQAGVASRRKCETLIREGRVRVNGRVVTTLGVCVDPRRDVIEVDGRRVRPRTRRVYLALNKPPGYVTTAHDPAGRPTVLDLVPAVPGLFPVGRLDKESEGLLILTNDGDFANQLMHPRYGHEKEYRVLVSGRPSPAVLRQLSTGVEIEPGVTVRARVRPLRLSDEGSWLSLTVCEGRRRQIRRMLALVGHPVLRLIRVRIGALKLRGLAPGQWRRLTEKERKLLLQ